MKIITRALLIACLSLFITACTTTASERADDADRVRLDQLATRLGSGKAESLLFFDSADRRIAFKSIDVLFPTRVVSAGTNPFPLADKVTDLSDVTYVIDDTTYTLPEFLKMPAAMGLIVVQDGDVLLEHYAPGIDRSTRWISFSVTKSLTSMLLGAAIRDGFIQSVDEPVAHYLPRLRGTPYEGVSIRDVLNMASGVAWNEDYEDPNSDVARAGGANGLDLVAYLAELPKASKPGETFNYNTGETNLAGEILRAAIGNNASEYLSHKIWLPFGMESDATWVLGVPGGGETGGCCLSATLRDYARIGIFAMNRGILRDGTQVLPDNWMSESTEPSPGYAGYGYLWWLDGDGSFAALGIFEQQIYIDPASGIVIAALGNAPSAVGSDYGRHLDALTQAIRLALAPKPKNRRAQMVNVASSVSGATSAHTA